MNRQLETYAAGLAHADGLGGVQDIPADQFGAIVEPATHWYRYYEQPHENGVSIYLACFRIVRETPKGVWLDAWRPKPKFVLRDAKKQFASATLDRAAEAFLARKKRHLRILNSQIATIETAVDQFVASGMKADNQQRALDLASGALTIDQIWNPR